MKIKTIIIYNPIFDRQKLVFSLGVDNVKDISIQWQTSGGRIPLIEKINGDKFEFYNLPFQVQYIESYM